MTWSRSSPREHYALTLNRAELTETERSAAVSAGEIELDLDVQ